MNVEQNLREHWTRFCLQTSSNDDDTVDVLVTRGEAGLSEVWLNNSLDTDTGSANDTRLC